MQQSDFIGQIHMGPSTSKTAKDAENPFEPIDRRLLQIRPQLAGLKHFDLTLHKLFLSLPDDWDLGPMIQQLMKHYGKSRATVYRAVKRLLEAGLLARIWSQRKRQNSYHTFELPCADRPQGPAARKRHVVTTTKHCHERTRKSPTAPVKSYGSLVPGELGPAFSGFCRRVSNLRHIQKREDVLKTEHLNTDPLSLGADAGFSNDSRVCRNGLPPAWPAIGAERPPAGFLSIAPPAIGRLADLPVAPGGSAAPATGAERPVAPAWPAGGRPPAGLLSVAPPAIGTLRPVAPGGSAAAVARADSTTTRGAKRGQGRQSPATHDVSASQEAISTSTPARGAKRQKGRSAPAKPHNTRKKMRRTRSQINLLQIRPKAGLAEEFMANLTSDRLNDAIDDIDQLPRTGTDAWVDAVRDNPLLAVLLDNLGLKTWGAQSLRRNLRLLVDRLPVADMLLYWVAERTGQWTGNIPQDMRARFDRDHPTKPDTRRDQIYPDVIRQYHTWQERMDTCREWLIEKVTKRAKAYYGAVDLSDPATIETHPLVWTAVLNSPIFADMCEVDPATVELARRTLKQVSKAEMRAWVDSVSEGLPVRWWGGWCLDGELETTFGTGVAAYLGEDLPRALVEPSGLAGDDYVTRIGAWAAEVPML